MILVVDDDKTIRLSLKLVLERNGYEVALAEEPKAAIQMIRSTPAVELVLMDMNYSMSTDGEEGLTLLRQVKVFRPDLPCILMTAWGSIDLAVQGMRAGAFDFLTKPWDNGVLLERIETAVKIKTLPQPLPVWRGVFTLHVCAIFAPREGLYIHSRLNSFQQHTVVPRLGDKVERTSTHALHG